MGKLRLYSYYRSSASYRVRIALFLKNLEFEYVPVHLIKDGGEQKKESYLAKNPFGQVPTLEYEGILYTQSLAILQYLDHLHPTPLLFPEDIETRTLVWSLCEDINSGIQPLQNIGTVQALSDMFKASEADKTNWMKFWITKGLKAFERRLLQHAGEYSVGDNISAVDVLLVPQVFAAHRFGVDLQLYPTLRKVYENCEKIEAFKKAHPSRQPDAPVE